MQHVHFVAGLDQNARFVHYFLCDSIRQEHNREPIELIGQQLGANTPHREDAKLLRSTFSECVLTGEPQECMIQGELGAMVQVRFEQVARNPDRAFHSDDEVVAIAVACQLPGEIELSRREQQIVRLICQDMSNAEIASELKLAASTIETHRQNIRKKIGARGTAGIVLYAVQHGLIGE